MTLPQSPTFMRIANGSFLSCPLSNAALFWASVNSMPCWSLLRRRHVDRRADGNDVEVLHGRARPDTGRRVVPTTGWPTPDLAA